MSKLEAYFAGEWIVPDPGVCTARWSAADWVDYIDACRGWTVEPRA